MTKEYSLTPWELRQLQLVELEMLREVDRLCKKHHIRYCIIAGTFLGAVRHSGFIPWDDDVDVALLRPEYERLREVCARELDSSRFFFQDNTTDPAYRWGYGKLRRKDSEFIRSGQEHMKYMSGIFIDIFPLDSVPDNLALRQACDLACVVIRKLLWSAGGAKSDKNPAMRLLYSVLAKIPAGFNFTLLNSLAGVLNQRHTEWVRILMFPVPDNGFWGYRRKWYEDLADITFEGFPFPSPRDRDGYLTFKFGDYMTLPPEEQRKTHPVSSFRLPEACNREDVQ